MSRRRKKKQDVKRKNYGEEKKLNMTINAWIVIKKELKYKGGIESLGRRRNRGKRESDEECLYYMRSRSNR